MNQAMVIAIGVLETGERNVLGFSLGASIGVGHLSLFNAAQICIFMVSNKTLIY